MKTGLKAIFDALNVLKAADPKSIESLSADIEALEKAGTAHGTGGSTTVEDTWQMDQRHLVPRAGEGVGQIPVGGGASASGSGAERLIARSSDLTAQQGLAGEVVRLGQMISFMGSTTKKALDGAVALIKAQDERIVTLVDLIGKVAKSIPAEDDDDNPTVSMARSLVTEVRELAESLGKAKSDLKKAEDDDEDEDEKKSCKSEIRRIRKAIAEKLEAAYALNAVGKSEKVSKSIKALATRTEVTVKALEDAAEAETAAAAKAAEEAATKKAAEEKAIAEKAAAGATGGATTTEIAPEAAKAVTEASEQLKKAIDGLGMLSTDVRGFLEGIQASVAKGPMKVPPLALELMKGDPSAIITKIQDRIEELSDSGSLDQQQSVRAQDLLGKYQATRSGQFAEATFIEMLGRASPAIQDAFKLAA